MIKARKNERCGIEAREDMMCVCEICKCLGLFVPWMVQYGTLGSANHRKQQGCREKTIQSVCAGARCTISLARVRRDHCE